MLVGQHRFSFCAVALICFGNGEHAGDGIAKIDGPAEPEVHTGCQPANLAADFSNHAANQQTMTDLAPKPLGSGEVFIVMNRVHIPADFAECYRVILGEGSGNRKNITSLETPNGLLSNVRHSGFSGISVWQLLDQPRASRRRSTHE